MKAARKGESYCQASDWCIILSVERKVGLLDCPFFRQDHEMKVSTLHPEKFIVRDLTGFFGGWDGTPLVLSGFFCFQLK